MEYGIQMYSVRDITQNDLLGAIKKVGALGYKYLEFAGFFGNSAESVKAAMDESGVYVSGTHTNLAEIEADINAVIKYHKTIGNKNIIIPGHDLSNQEKIDDFVARAAAASRILADNGITLGYHNHSREFQPNTDGSMIHDQLVYRTSLLIEIDTFWHFNATGFSAVECMERLKNRLHFIHIKDGMRGGRGVPLGKGEAPVLEVYKKAAEMGVPMVVESETLTPDGMTEAQICIEYLKNAEK